MSKLKSYTAAAAILKKSKNFNISASVLAISTKIGKVMQFDPLDRSDRWKIEILKIKDGGGELKYRNHHISAAVQAIFLWNLVRWHTLTFLTAPTFKNLKFQKSKMAA